MNDIQKEAQHVIAREKWLRQWIMEQERARLAEFEDEEQEHYDNGDHAVERGEN